MIKTFYVLQRTELMLLKTWEGRSYLVMLLLGVTPDKRLNHLIAQFDGSTAIENKTRQVMLH
jgi:hypothetical protein